jgi:sulfur-oxidizing protein SoxX
MRIPKIAIPAVSAIAIAMGGTFLNISTATAEEASAIEEGKSIAFNRKKGNCLACHAIAGGKLPGNIGPVLKGMAERFPDKAALRAQIFDATVSNPYTIMPPFGKHNILTKNELDKVVEFIYSL